MRKNKFSIRLLLIALGLLLCIQMPTFAANKGKSTATNVRIRKGASTQSEVIDVLALGDEVEILTEEGDWYKISAKGHTGYVSKSFISVDGNVQENNSQAQENTTELTNNEPQENKDENATSTETNNEQTVQSETQPQENVNVNKVYKVSENAKVYILPVLTSEVIGEVKKDENVTLLDNAGLWVFVQTQNINGWVRIDKLSAENVSVDNTVNNQNNENTNIENNEDTTTNKDTNQTTENNDANNNEQANYQAKTMYVKASAINVRSQSNTSSDIVTSVTLNTEVKVVGEENGWYKVEVNGKSGYIRNDLLSDKKTEVSSRDNEVDRTQQAEKNEATSNVNTQTATQATTQTTTQTSTNTSSSTSSNVPTSSTGVTGNDIVAYAKQFQGYRYVYGAAGPNSFDCSGFTMYVYKHFGYSLSHSSRVQATQGKKVTGELQPGDILVFTNGGTQIGHVGIYIGNDKFIHASDSTTGVIISNLSDRWNKSKYVGARRIL